MNTFVKVTFSFALGACVGVIASERYFNKVYKKIADEEIESVKNMFLKKTGDCTTETVENKTELKRHVEKSSIQPFNKKEDLLKYSNILKDANYGTVSSDEDTGTNHPDAEDDHEIDPFVISPDEFGSEYDYDNVSLVYYADGVLADDEDNIIVDIDDVVGEESLTQFGVYEADSVFVRNPRLKTDFEILLDSRNWSDVSGG